MLLKARQEAPGVTFVEAGIEQWSPPEPADLLFTNSTLQWLDDHARLFPRLLAQLAPQGVLAVQMPHNHDAPSHAAMREAAEEGPWRAQLRDVRSIRPVGSPADYYRILRAHCAADRHLGDRISSRPRGRQSRGRVDQGTGLRPYLDALKEPERGAFLAAYAGAHRRALSEAAGWPARCCRSGACSF